MSTSIYRRQLLKTGIAGAAAIVGLQSRVFAAAGDKPLRVALIGCGWYGKTDLLHLMQVAPVILHSFGRKVYHW